MNNSGMKWTILGMVSNQNKSEWYEGYQAMEVKDSHVNFAILNTPKP